MHSLCLLTQSGEQTIILMINICFAPEPSGANVKKYVCSAYLWSK
jgi:hypothetical protein